ncbi:hypothetical protein OG444_02655 [Streptomyces sp. NBC_01232]|nr:hypothetical protein OG444_02655 [Streptomyces sp. NBC_01232]
MDALLRNGVDRDNIHVDVASGAKASRPKLDLVMQLMRAQASRGGPGKPGGPGAGGRGADPGR